MADEAGIRPENARSEDKFRFLVIINNTLDDIILHLKS